MTTPAAVTPPTAGSTIATPGAIAPTAPPTPAPAAAVTPAAPAPSRAKRQPRIPAAPANPQPDLALTRIQALGFESLAELLVGLEEIGNTLETAPQETPNVTTPGQPAPITPAPGPAPAAIVTPPAPAATVAPTPPAIAQPPAGAAPQPGDDLANSRSLPDHVRKRVHAFREDMKSKEAAARAEAEQYRTQALTYEQQISVMRAEEGMKIELARTGIRDMDFAWWEFTKALKALRDDKSPEAVEKLKTFTASTWAEEQRKARPYLFGEQGVPANGGAGAPAAAAAAGNPAPGAPGTSQVTNNVAAAGQFNGRTAPAAEFEQRMKAHGINYRHSRPPLRE